MHVIVCFTVSCPAETTALLKGTYNWSSIMAEEIQIIDCTYMGEGDRECEVVSANATRVCNDIGKWEEPDVSNCLTRITQTLCEIRNVRGNLLKLWINVHNTLQCNTLCSQCIHTQYGVGAIVYKSQNIFRM